MLFRRLRTITADLGRRTGIDLPYYLGGSVYFGIGQLVEIAAGLLISILFAAHLAKEVYGAYRYLLSIFAILGGFAMPGMGTALTQSIARGFDGSYSVIIKSGFKWGLAGTVAAWGIAFYFFLTNNNSFALVFLLVGLLYPPYVVCGYYGPFLLGKKQLARNTLFGIFYRIIFTGIMIAALFLIPKAGALMIVFVLCDTLIRGVFTIYSLRYRNNKSADPLTTRYGRDLSFISFIQTISGYIDQLLLGWGLGFASLAVYNILILIPDKLKDLAGIIASLLFPKLATWENNAPTRRSLWRATIIMTVLAIIGIVIYLFLADPLIKLFFPKYLEAINLSRWYSISAIGIVAILPTTWFQAQKKIKAIWWFNLSNAFLQIGLSVSLIPFFGLVGAVLAKVLTRILSSLIALFFLSRDNKLPIPNSVS